MNITFKGTDYELTNAVTDVATKKIDSLAKYMRGKDAGAQAYVELGKAVGAQQSGDIWRAEVNLDLEGARFRAEATRGKIEDAIDECVAELSRSLRNAKRRDQDRERKGGATIKSILRGFWPGT